MTHRDVILEALRSLIAHPLRAALASIGVIAGVGTIVAALAIADGARRQARADIGALGMDNVIVRAAARRDARGRTVSPALTLDDVAMLARRMPDVTFAALRSVNGPAATSDRAVTATIAGVTAAWRTTANLTVATGRWFSPRESGARVAVIGAAWSRDAFGDDDPIGERVLAAGEWRTVIGVLAPASVRGPARASSDGLDTDRSFFVPFKCWSTLPSVCSTTIC